MLQVKENPPEPALACPAPTRMAAAKIAKQNIIIFALMNQDFIDFGMNWYMHLDNMKVRRSTKKPRVMHALCLVLQTEVWVPKSCIV